MGIADLHIHSKYSRATSKDMNIESLSKSAKIKGITLLGTGDFTHPLWMKEIKEKLSPIGNGFYECNEQKFVLTSEISTIYSQDGKCRRVHHLILMPSIEDAENLNKELSKIGNLKADGRPILGLSSIKLAEKVFGTCENALLISAHVWTPWFSVFGSMSGFDRIEDCYGEFTNRIFAIETGLSSDPAMNWRISALDKYTLISNSDCHSASKIGREANVFSKLDSYTCLYNNLKNKENFSFTLEFYPEEGKYHFDGHRNCNICLNPSESIKIGNICPKCKKPLTVGVLHRVCELADRGEGFVPKNSIPFKKAIPLAEVISGVYNKGVGTKFVLERYNNFISRFGTEFEILLNSKIEEINEVDEKIGGIIEKIRTGKMEFLPGYDGVYGVPVFDKNREIKRKIDKIDEKKDKDKSLKQFF